MWKLLKECSAYYINENGDLKNDREQLLNRKTNKKNNNYQFYILCINGKPTAKYIHRLVANNFIENPENKDCVNHIDDDHSNNHVSNLRWMTRTEIQNVSFNNPEKRELRIKKLSVKKNKTIRYYTQVIHKTFDGKILNVFKSALEASKELGIPISTVNQKLDKVFDKKQAKFLTNNLYRVYNEDGSILFYEIKRKDLLELDLNLSTIKKNISGCKFFEDRFFRGKVIKYKV